MSYIVVDHKLTGYRLDEVEGYVAAARTITGELAHLEPWALARSAMHLADGIGREHLDLVIAETVSAVRGDRPATEPPSTAVEPAAGRDVVAETAKVRAMNGFTTPPTPVRAAPTQEPGTGPPASLARTINSPDQASDLGR